jgi:hypothetical protein
MADAGRQRTRRVRATDSKNCNSHQRRLVSLTGIFYARGGANGFEKRASHPEATDQGHFIKTK